MRKKINKIFEGTFILKVVVFSIVISIALEYLDSFFIVVLSVFLGFLLGRDFEKR